MATHQREDAPQVRVVLVGDSQTHAMELAYFLEDGEEIELAGAFTSTACAVEAIVGGLDVQVALVDLRLRRASGVELIGRLKAARPSLEVVVLTVFDDDESLYGALRAGACGYLVEDVPRPEIVAALQEAHHGGTPMSRGIARRVLSRFRDPPGAPAAPLTTREREVLELLTRGASYPMIASALHIATSTVQTHIRALYRKLEVSTKAEATAEAYRRGLVR